MHIALVGMSNIGKSHWAARLAAEAGFTCVDCDHEVEGLLGTELTRLGYAGLQDVARWMGQPYESRYEETSGKYIACEKEVMQNVVARLRDQASPPLVIDTTGSVIYVGDDVIEALRQSARVIYLEAPTGHIDALFARYLAEPKPVIWGDAYAPRTGESPQDCLRRCYTDLLTSRARRYQAIAHVTIPFEQHHHPAADVRALLDAEPDAA